MVGTGILPAQPQGPDQSFLARSASRPYAQDLAVPQYTDDMLDESQFRQHSESALESLKQSLIRAEEDGEFEVEEQNGVLNIVFEQPVAKFVLTPNTPVRQIWISALSTSFKLEWSDAHGQIYPPQDRAKTCPPLWHASSIRISAQIQLH